jgi:hypothetical protein
MGTYTPNRNLYKPADNEVGWGDLVDANWDDLDDAAHQSDVTALQSQVATLISTPSWANTTPATGSVSQPSPALTLSGQYWNGSASAADTWTAQDVIGNGTNGTSTLTFTHTGSTGTALVSLPALQLYQGASTPISITPSSSTLVFAGSGGITLSCLAGINLAGSGSAFLSMATSCVCSGGVTAGLSTALIAETRTNATSLQSQSCQMQLTGNYWNGSASATDTWTILNSLANGTNGTSTLTFSHTGTTGAARVSLPLLTVAGAGTAAAAALSFGTAGAGWGFYSGTGGRFSLAANGTSVFEARPQGLNFGSGMVVGWSSAGTPDNVASDTGISRAAAGVVAVGNGTAGDTSGTVQCAKVLGGASMRGTVSSASGTTVSVTFGSAYGSTPVIVVTPTTNCGAFFISAQSSTGFTITYATSGAQSFNWIAIG